jgi:hypothetical protein
VAPRTFRARLSLRLALAAAAVVWAAALAALAFLPGAPWASVASALAFLAFFLCYSAHYGRMAVVVRPDGVVFRSVFRQLRVTWDEILKVEVRVGLAGTLYAVLTRRGCVQFSSLLARHRELCQLMLDRAGLVRT